MIDLTYHKHDIDRYYQLKARSIRAYQSSKAIDIDL